jgi:hypothetical protein
MSAANPYGYTSKRVARHVYSVPTRTPDPKEQPALDFTPPQPDAGEPTITARFARFHADNPGVYTEIHSQAVMLANNGARRISVKHLVEQVRADGCQTTGDGGYGLNNDFTRCYADLLAEDPRLAGLIERRARKAE